MSKVLRVYKECLGFGPPSTIIVYECPNCHKEVKIVKNWHGQTPNGGALCPHNCGGIVTFAN